jgi:copper chaperone CopZ
MNETITYSVPDISSGHCRAAIIAEVSAVAGVQLVEVNLDAKLVRVAGGALNDASIRQAIHEAGYTAADSSSGKEATR